MNRCSIINWERGLGTSDHRQPLLRAADAEAGIVCAKGGHSIHHHGGSGLQLEFKQQ